MKLKQDQDHFVVNSYSGEDFSVNIPALHEALPVTRINTKAFLSCKQIVELTLPDSMEEIGDWAFAHMKNLKTLTLPGKQLTFGKNVFLDCTQLEKILISDTSCPVSGMEYLLASAVTILDKVTLCRPDLAGSSTAYRKWLTLYDDALHSFLTAPDDFGFDPVFLGWFDVEDFDSQRNRFLIKRRKEKTYLCFLRLLYDGELTSDFRRELQDYLTMHMPAGALSTEHIIPFTELCQVYNTDVRYLQCIVDAGYLTPDTIQELLTGLSDASLEVKALLLQYQQQFCKEIDFFGGFVL